MSVLDRPFATGLNGDINRECTAYHEATHGVVAAALGIPFRYLTMNPRAPKAAGMVMTTPATYSQLHRLGRWREDAAWTLGGIIVEDLWNEALWYRYTKNIKLRTMTRRDIVRHHGGPDLRIVRDNTKFAWFVESCDPGWASTKIDLKTGAIVDLAIDAWQLAVWTVARYWSAIDVVAEMLFESSKAVQWKTVKNVVDGEGPDDDVELPVEYLEPWFLSHSRLRWEPSTRWYDELEEMKRERQLEAAS